MRQRTRRFARFIVCFGVMLALAQPAANASAASAGPTVIAVHRNAAVDVRGLSKFGTIAKVVLPAGNWSLTANATLQGTDGVSRIECQLTAGSDFYKGRTWTTKVGSGSLQAMVLLLSHHFSTSGTAVLKCYSDGVTGDVLIRDVRLTAVRVGKLTTDGGTTGSANPRAYFTADSSLRFVPAGINSFTDVGHVSLPAGRWLVQASGWAIPTTAPSELDCKLVTASTTPDETESEIGFIHEESFGLEGIAVLASPGSLRIACASGTSVGMVQTAISAFRIGRLSYRHLGSAATSSGTGTPVVVAGYSDDPAYIASGGTLTAVGSLPLGPGSWVVSAKLSSIAAASATVTCQLRVGADSDQGRIKLDTPNYPMGWVSLSLTHRLATASTATMVCDESGGPNVAAFWRLKIIALKAGSVRDTAL